MRRREERAISKHTLNLYAGDYGRLQRYYGTRVGAAKIIREIIHAHIRKVEEKAAQTRADKLVGELDLNLDPETI